MSAASPLSASRPATLQPGALAGSPALTIKIFESAAAFDELRDSWQSLHDLDVRASVFASWEWQSCWWRHYGKDQPLRIVAIYAAEGLVGIAAAYVQKVRTYRNVQARVLRWVGTGGDTSPDDLGPVLSAAYSEAAAIAIGRKLLELASDCDVMVLSDLDEEAPFWRATLEAAARSGRTISRSGAAHITYVTLPETWEDYLRSVGRDRRYTIRSTRRKAATKVGAEFVAVHGGAQLCEMLDRLGELHRLRWSSRGVAHAFSTPEYVGFHRDVVQLCATRAWIRLYGLLVNGAPVAAFYCYSYRGRIFYFQSGFDPQYERLRPGLVLMGHAIESAIGEGNEVFDFLRGQYPYKAQWGKGTRRTGTLTQYLGGWRALGYRCRFEWMPLLKESLRRRVPWLMVLMRRLKRRTGR